MSLIIHFNSADKEKERKNEVVFKFSAILKEILQKKSINCSICLQKSITYKNKKQTNLNEHFMLALSSLFFIIFFRIHVDNHFTLSCRLKTSRGRTVRLLFKIKKKWKQVKQPGKEKWKLGALAKYGKKQKANKQEGWG